MSDGVERRPRARVVGSAVGLLVLASGSCGGGSPAPAVLPAPVERRVEPPPGVDSLVAVEVDSLAATAFVPAESQLQAAESQESGLALIERSDSLWAALERARDRPEQDVSTEEIVQANEAIGKGGEALVALDDVLRDPDLSEAEVLRRTAILLDSAEHALQRAFQLNPYDTRNRVWLAQVYELQARRLGQAGAFAEAVSQLEKLTLLTPDQHEIYAMLANNYFRLSDWDRAAAAYARAMDVYLATHDLVVDEPPPVDSTLVLGYARAEGEMHVRRLDADGARVALGKGLQFVRSEEDRQALESELEWIDWDAGDIANAMARDSLAALAEAGALQEALMGFRHLRERVSTPEAADETEWRLAIVEYNLGDAETAAGRLQALAARIPRNESGGAAEAPYARYLEDYGTLCLNLGRELIRDRRDSRTALMYFTQATRFGWSGRALAHFEVARLLQANVSAALEAAESALGEEASLTDAQRADLYRLLMDLHRRAGAFDQAREFRDAYRALVAR